MKFKAAILVEQKRPLEIETIELNEKLHYGQVLVKLNYSGICGSQLGEIDGVKGKDNYLPHLLGHEGSGVVVDVGPGVKKFNKDDDVILHWRPSDGIQSDPPKYSLNGNIINAGWVTTFNEYAVVSENRLTTDSFPRNKKVSSLFGCAVTTGFGAIENNVNPKIGQSIVIYGAGGVGLNMIQAAKIMKLFPIVAIDRFDNRLDLARQCGATHVFNSTKCDNDLIKSSIKEYSIDFFIDNTGSPKVIEFGYSLINKNGKLVLVGVPGADENIHIHSLPMHFGKKIVGSHGGETIPHHDIPRLQKLCIDSECDFEALITEEYSLDEINIAINRMRLGEMSGRCTIHFK
jgi:S-(hydroxymethyl)glutathione dehydrogenase/alcohol dehydrogenase